MPLRLTSAEKDLLVEEAIRLSPMLASGLSQVGREEEGTEIFQWTLPILAPVETPAGRQRTRDLVDLLAGHFEAAGEEARAAEVRRRWGEAGGG